MKKPIMSAEVESQVMMALSRYANQEKYRRWGLHEIRDQGSAILLVGPPGTGKTTIAEWMAARVKKGFRILTVAEIGGGGPGDSERNVNNFFDDCKRRGNITIFLDECNVLLMDRSQVKGDGQTWMIGTTEALMMNINRYKGCLIAATNHSKSMDPAVADRFIAIVEVGKPDFDCRIKLWKQKWPKQFPLQITEAMLAKLAAAELTGRQIENIIVAVGSHCININKMPKMLDFEKFIIRELGKHTDHENA